MIDTNLQGSIAEHTLMLELSKYGFSVFISTTGKTEVDIVGIRDRLCYRFQVKSTSRVNEYGSYEAGLKSVRPNRSENIIHKFDGDSCDILVIYCVQDNVLQYFDPLLLNNRSSININPKDFERNTLKALLRD